MCQNGHNKCQNLTHLFVVDGLTHEVSKIETFCSVFISRKNVPKQETKCFKKYETQCFNEFETKCFKARNLMYQNKKLIVSKSMKLNVSKQETNCFKKYET